MSKNRVIGKNNCLPWHLPNDLQHFKRITSGKPIIMGRKTFDSIGRPLPYRTNIVISRSSGNPALGAKYVMTIDDALSLADAEAQISGAEEVVVIGGAEIYRQTLPLAARLYCTLVHAEVPGDAYFPEFDWQQFQQIKQQHYHADAHNPYDYSFSVYEKIARS